MTAKLSVVIPHWNGKHFLPPCLDSLQRQTYPSLEVIIVDNASTDGSQSLVRDQYPWVRLIELVENRGFTGACNIGMQAAQGEIVALLNVLILAIVSVVLLLPTMIISRINPIKAIKFD